MCVANLCIQISLSDRALMPGDVVRRLVEGHDSQRGYVTYTYVQCHVQVLNRPAVICNVDTRDLLPLMVRKKNSFAQVLK